MNGESSENNIKDNKNLIKQFISTKRIEGCSKRTEDYYFNLSKAELLEMEVGTTGGYAEKVQAIIDAKDSPDIMKIFKELLLKAYGEKSADGKRFIKIDDNGRPLAIAFEQTPAYSEIFMELATDADAGSAFINGILPADLIKEANKAALPKAAN